MLRRAARLASLRDRNCDQRTSILVLDVKIRTRPIRVAFARYEFSNEQTCKAPCGFLVWQMCPSHIIVLFVVVSDGELIFRHLEMPPGLGEPA
jgi:hypothetical protein